MIVKKIKESGQRIRTDIKAYGPALIVFLVYYVIVHLLETAFCPLIQITGLPCAGCGLTRAFLFIARGEFGRAWFIHPLSFAIIAFVLYCAFFRYVRGSKIWGLKPLFVMLIGCLLIFYVIRMFLYFPDRVPYVYAGDNVLANYLPGYKELITRVIDVLRRIRSA